MKRWILLILLFIGILLLLFWTPYKEDAVGVFHEDISVEIINAAEFQKEQNQKLQEFKEKLEAAKNESKVLVDGENEPTESEKRSGR